MNICQVKAVKALFGAGSVLELTADQSKPRAHNLRQMGENLFEVINPVEFRTGEVLGFAGDVPLTLLDLLEVSGPEPVEEVPSAEDEPTPEELPVAPIATPSARGKKR